MMFVFYGQPKAGKTTLAFSGKADIFLDYDFGAQFVDTKGCERVEAPSVSWLHGFQPKRGQWVIVDTLTQMHAHILNELTAASPSRSSQPTLKHRAAANDVLGQFLRSVRGAGAHLVATCQDRVDAAEDWRAPDDANQEAVRSLGLDLPRGAASKITAMADVIGRVYINDDRERVCWLASAPGQVTGARSAVWDNDPPYVVDPTLPKIAELLGYTKQNQN